MRKKLLSAFLAFTLSVGIAVPSVLAADAAADTGTAKKIEAINLDIVVADTLYHETTANNWYDGLVDEEKATVTVTGTDTAKIFNVVVPLALEASVALDGDMSTKAGAIAATLENEATRSLTLGFQLGLPETIDSKDVDYSKTTINRTRDGETDTPLAYFIGSDGYFADQNGLSGKVPKTTFMYAKAINFTREGDTAIEKVADGATLAAAKDFKVIDETSTRQYVYSFYEKVDEPAKEVESLAEDVTAAEAPTPLATYTVNITTTPKEATEPEVPENPENPDPDPTTKPVAVITNSTLDADTLYHEGQRTDFDTESAPLGGNWYTGLAVDSDVKVTTTTNGENKTFDVTVPLALVGGSNLTDKALDEAKAMSKYIANAPLNNAATKNIALGFQLALPQTIGDVAIDFSKTTLKNAAGDDRKANIYFGTNDANRYEAVLGENAKAPATIKTALMYTNAITFLPATSATQGKGEEGTDFKVRTTPATGTYVYTFKDADSKDLATYTINFTTTPKAAPAAKPITFSTEAKNGQQADGKAEFKYKADPTLGFDLDATVTANSITVTGKTTAERLTAESPDDKTNSAFVTYFQVPGLKVADVKSVRTTRDGTVLSTNALVPAQGEPANAYAPEDKVDYLHFKKATNFVTRAKDTDPWTMKYTKPYTEKVELLDAGGIVIASVTYTVDLSGAVIGNANVTVTSPETGTGVVAGDIPSKVEIPNGDKTLADIKVATGIQDADGKNITVADVTKVDLKVVGISTEDATPAVLADKKLINAQPAIAKDGAKVAFLDIKLEFTVNAVKKLISTLGDKAVEILVAIPANLISEGATYTIFTVHNNKLSPITPELSFDKKSLKFNANKFSTFAIVATPKAVVPPVVDPDVPTPPTPPVNPSNPTPPASNNSGSTYTGGGSGYYSYDSRPTYSSVTTITDKTALGVAITFPIGIRGVATPSFTVSELAKMDDEFRVFMALAQGFDVLSVYDINLFDSNRKVGTVDGGLITVTLPYAQGKAGVNYKILRNNEDGTITEIPATFNGGLITFETNRFGKFSVAVSSGTVIPSDTATTLPAPDTTTPAPTVPPTTANPQTGDVNPIGLLAILLIAGASMLVISKKVRV